jgi:hypothetical protein
LEFFADLRDPLLGKVRTELMKAGGSHGSRRQPSRGAETDGAEFWMSRTDSSVQLQTWHTVSEVRII